MSIKHYALTCSVDPADFFPWNGNHPEDTLSEQSAKSGYYDKIQLLSNEVNVGRSLVWSCLKHRSGVQILSSLLSSSLDYQLQRGKVTAKCTFKPPPRVTLTDTKREVWLRDLANPLIPLRRLSRTIPHGVRGSILLDHCLVKRVPTWRAVWLMKCVGANEIRAFRRKGTSAVFASGGETKWIRDWTSDVEQFIQSLIGQCGSQDWKFKMTYTMVLTQHIYSEHLIDKEHFLDWILTSLHESKRDDLPIWLLLSHTYWDELTRYRYRGRRLAETILEHLHQTVHQQHQAYDLPTGQQLRALLKALALTQPDCFLLPNCWIKYQSLFESSIDLHDTTFLHCYEQILKSNRRCLRGLEDSTTRRTQRQTLIAALDSSANALAMGLLSRLCLDTVQDNNLLISTLIEWSTTPYRFGQTRIYIAIDLLRQWDRDGIEVEGVILELLDHVRDMSLTQQYNLHKIVAELVRSSHFSVAKYLQRLVLRGSLGADTTSKGVGTRPNVSSLTDRRQDRFRNLPPQPCTYTRIVPPNTELEVDPHESRRLASAARRVDDSC